MRILFVHDVLGERGGAEANVRHAASGLQKRGAELAFLHGESTCVGTAPFEQLFPTRFDWSHSPAKEALSRALAWGPDVVYVHKLARRELLEGLVESGRPLVRMVHDHDMYCQRTYRYFPWNREICTRRAGYGCALTCGVLRSREGLLPVRLAWPGEKLAELAACRRFDRHIVISQYMKAELELHDFDPQRITILPPAPRAAKDGFEATYAEPLLVFVGQILRGKGVDVLLRALTRLRTEGWRCLVIGEGSHRAHCETLTRRLGLQDRVHFTGWIPQAELHEHLRRARLGVVPSVWPEPLGNVGIEFMHHALPVVAFDAGGIRDWLDDGRTGHLVPLWDLDLFARRVDELLSDPARARQLGAAGLARAQESWNHERSLDALHELLQREAARR